MFDLKRRPIHPGEILNLDYLEPMDISQTQLARNVGTTFRTINEIVNGKRGISPDMAIRLGRYFGTAPELWLNLQNQYDLYEAKAKNKGVLQRIKPHKPVKQAV